MSNLADPRKGTEMEATGVKVQLLHHQRMAAVQNAALGLCAWTEGGLGSEVGVHAHCFL